MSCTATASSTARQQSRLASRCVAASCRRTWLPSQSRSGASSGSSGLAMLMLCLYASCLSDAALLESKSAREGWHVINFLAFSAHQRSVWASNRHTNERSIYCLLITMYIQKEERCEAHREKVRECESRRGAGTLVMVTTRSLILSADGTRLDIRERSDALSAPTACDER